MSNTNIIGYTINLDEMKSSTCGMIGIAKKSGKKYFCKKFNNPVEPADTGALSPKAIERNRAEFEAFKSRKKRVNTILREISGLGGNIVFPIEETVYEYHWMEFTEFINDALPEDRYADVIAALNDTEKLLVLKIAIGALQTIHGQKMVHGDLKLTNIMLVKNSSGHYVSKIIDFDGAFFEDDVPLDSITGTVDYYSPELALYSCNEDPEIRKKISKMITTKSDIFTMGLILHEYLTGSKPKPDHLTSSLQKLEKTGKFIYPWQILLTNDKDETKSQLVISDKITEPSYVALISDMLNLEPDQRPTAAEVMKRLNNKEVPIETDTWPEDHIAINEDKARSGLVALRKIERTEKGKPTAHVYEIVKPDGRRYYKTAEELVKLGFAQVLERWLPPRPEDDIEWNLEQLQRTFISVRPNDTPGIYQLYDKHGESRLMSSSQMKMMGLARTRTPVPASTLMSGELWPEHEKNMKLDNKMLDKYKIKFLGSAIMNGIQGYKFEMVNGDEQFWTLQKCKMMKILIEK